MAAWKWWKWLGLSTLLFLFPPAGAEETESQIADRKSQIPMPLAAEEEKLFQAGKDLYEVTCLSCHQANGMGLDALAPPLVGSHWVTNSVERLVRIALHGMRGPVKVNGRVYRFETEMLPLAVLSDEQLAAVLTYVRREWGHRASPVSTAIIAKIREATASREQPWTEDELLKIP